MEIEMEMEMGRLGRRRHCVTAVVIVDSLSSLSRQDEGGGGERANRRLGHRCVDVASARCCRV